MLEIKAEVAEWHNLANSLVATNTTSASPAEMLALIAAMLEAQGKEDVAGMLRSETQKLEAFTSVASQDSSLLPALMAVLHEDAGPTNSNALQSWLQFAPTEEIADHIQALLEGVFERRSQQPPEESDSGDDDAPPEDEPER